MRKEKLSTPPKNYVNKSSIVSPFSSPHENMNIDNPSDQLDVDLRETIKVNSTNSTSRNISEGKVSTESGKISKTHADPFTTCLDINSLEGFKKQKCVKATIKAPIKSYMYLCIEQKKDKS